jgi:hypothetical protein
MTSARLEVQPAVCEDRAQFLPFEECAEVSVRLLRGRPEARESYVHVQPVLGPQQPLVTDGLRKLNGASDLALVRINRVRTPHTGARPDTITARVFAVQLVLLDGPVPPRGQHPIVRLHSDTAYVVLHFAPVGQTPAAPRVSVSLKHEVRRQ